MLAEKHDLITLSPAKIDPRWGVIAEYEASGALTETIWNKSHLDFSNLVRSRPEIDDRKAFVGYNSDFSNHYHIMMEWLSAIRTFAQFRVTDQLLLLPESHRCNEAICAAIEVLSITNQVLFIDDVNPAPQAFASLTYSPNLRGKYNYVVTQQDLEFFDLLGQRILGNSNMNGPSRIYLARKDSKNRVLENEDVIEKELCQDLGFVSVTLANMPLAIQVLLFTSATVVVAPHGAGLVNLLFRSPKNRLIVELQPTSYKNPCFAAISQANGDTHSLIELKDSFVSSHQHFLRCQATDETFKSLRSLLDQVR